MKTILLGLVILSTSACLGDDPDHLDAVGPSTLSTEISPLSGVVPSGFHGRLLKMITRTPTSPSTETAFQPLDLTSNWAMTVDAPEICQDCTLSLIHQKLDVETDGGATNTITVWDDARQVEICTIALQLAVNAKTMILADTCGTTFADTSLVHPTGG